MEELRRSRPAVPHSPAGRACKGYPHRRVTGARPKGNFGLHALRGKPAPLPHRRQSHIPGVDDTEAVEQPQDYDDHDHDVEDLFDRGLHGDIGVDQPEDHADDYQGNDDV